MHDKYVQEWCLSTNEVNFDVMRKLVVFGQERELTITSHLSEKVINATSNHFKKMDVGLAMKVLSHKTASAIKWLVAEYPDEFPHYYLTTAFFIEQVAQWWDIMKSRSIKFCFHKDRPVMYRENHEFLEKFMDFWGTMKCHEFQVKSYWDPQKAALLATSSVLRLADKLVKEEGDKFFLPGRVLNDAIENFFSCVRLMSKSPTPLQFKRVTKAICITQFLHYSPRGSYEEDDSERFLVDFDDFQTEMSKEIDADFEEEQEDLDTIGYEDFEELEKEDYDPDDKAEACALANIAAVMLDKTVKSGKSKCKKCTDAFVTSHEVDQQECNSFLKMKEYKEGMLTLPSVTANAMFRSAELTFRFRRVKLLRTNKQVAKKLLEFVLSDFEKEFVGLDVPTCHLKIIFGRFLRSRCHFWAKKSNELLVKKQAKEIEGGALSSASSYQTLMTRKSRIQSGGASPFGSDEEEIIMFDPDEEGMEGTSTGSFP